MIHYNSYIFNIKTILRKTPLMTSFQNVGILEAWWNILWLYKSEDISYNKFLTHSFKHIICHIHHETCFMMNVTSSCFIGL